MKLLPLIDLAITILQQCVLIYLGFCLFGLRFHKSIILASIAAACVNVLIYHQTASFFLRTFATGAAATSVIWLLAKKQILHLIVTYWCSFVIYAVVEILSMFFFIAAGFNFYNLNSNILTTIVFSRIVLAINILLIIIIRKTDFKILDLEEG